MEKNIGPIWISLAVLVLAIIIFTHGDSLKAMELKSGSSPFLIALTQLGILYIVALFVERALEVIIKAWRQGERIQIEQEKNTETDEKKISNLEKKLEEYRAGTRKRALLTGLTLGILVSVSGVRLLGPIFQFDGIGEMTFQYALFQFTDIIITAGLIAGGSSTIHELMALIDDFLRASRRRANQ